MAQDNGSSNVAAMVIVVVLIIVIAAFAYFLGFRGKESTSVNKTEAELNVENRMKSNQPSDRHTSIDSGLESHRDANRISP